MRNFWYLVVYDEKSFKFVQIKQIYFERFEKICEIYFPSLREQWPLVLSRSDTHHQMFSTWETWESLLYLHLTDIKKYLELKYVDILGIDDLGIEMIETLEYGNVCTPIVDLLSSRYEHQNTTIITSNLTPRQVREKYGERILSFSLFCTHKS